jgi:hypothetical protein
VVVGAVGMGLVPVVAVAAPPGQALERGLGGLPVAAAAGGLPAGVSAQQPLRVDLVPPVARHDQQPAVTLMMDTLAAAAPLPLLATSISRLAGERSDRRSGLPVPGHSAPTMLRPPRVVEAVGAPIAVQLRSVWGAETGSCR